MRDEEKGGEELQLPDSGTAATTTVEDDPAFLVKWDTDDAENPYNWSTLYKTWVTFELSMLALAASVTSSMIAPANHIIAEYIGVSDTVAVLNVSLFVYDTLPVVQGFHKVLTFLVSDSVLDLCYGDR